MKLIIAVVQVYDTDRLLRLVTDAGLRATRIVSTGGFLHMQNATVLIGAADERVAEAVDLVRGACRSRVEVTADLSAPELADWLPGGIHDVTLGGGVVFIVPVERFLRVSGAVPAPACDRIVRGV
ncbi:MAG: cyclic-di-AMP receptor [Chloroflexia bacterium]|nr:cyclic-di-AMP receptor [Chloroflexia bacterium]MBA3642373.1 cyclic-di-AMP receptor [Acidobacteriota bacterium]